jgi:myo-inositol-1-phosphate synthase
MATKKSAVSKSKRPTAGVVEPAKGKLGVMVVGLGAVATTMIAGVEAVRQGLAKPVGSLTQMGTIRLGKRTDNESPLIKDFVPLADLKDVVFTGWDIFKDNVYESAVHAAVLDKETLAKLKPSLEKIKPMPAVFDQAERHPCEERQDEARPGQSSDCRHSGVQEEGGSCSDDLVRIHGDLSGADRSAPVDQGF